MGDMLGHALGNAWILHGSYVGETWGIFGEFICTYPGNNRGIDPAANFMALGMGFHAFHIYVVLWEEREIVISQNRWILAARTKGSTTMNDGNMSLDK